MSRDVKRAPATTLVYGTSAHPFRLPSPVVHRFIMIKDEDDVDDMIPIPQSQDPSFLRRLAGASAHKAG